jgi:hypothetical protein
MLFTVVLAVNMDEEAAAKTELSKKSSDPEPEDGAKDSNADSDDDVNNVLNDFFDYDWGYYHLDTELYDYSNNRYLSFYVNISTPPPKV